MTVCPIAVVAGCSKCPVVKICPLKTVLGDAPKAVVVTPPKPSKRRAAPRAKK